MGAVAAVNVGDAQRVQAGGVALYHVETPRWTVPSALPEAFRIPAGAVVRAHSSAAAHLAPARIGSVGIQYKEESTAGRRALSLEHGQSEGSVEPWNLSVDESRLFLLWSLAAGSWSSIVASRRRAQTPNFWLAHAVGREGGRRCVRSCTPHSLWQRCVVAGRATGNATEV